MKLINISLAFLALLSLSFVGASGPPRKGRKPGQGKKPNSGAGNADKSAKPIRQAGVGKGGKRGQKPGAGGKGGPQKGHREPPVGLMQALLDMGAKMVQSDNVEVVAMGNTLLEAKDRMVSGKSKQLNKADRKKKLQHRKEFYNKYPEWGKQLEAIRAKFKMGGPQGGPQRGPSTRSLKKSKPQPKKRPQVKRPPRRKPKEVPQYDKDSYFHRWQSFYAKIPEQMHKQEDQGHKSHYRKKQHEQEIELEKEEKLKKLQEEMLHFGEDKKKDDERRPGSHRPSHHPSKAGPSKYGKRPSDRDHAGPSGPEKKRPEIIKRSFAPLAGSDEKEERPTPIRIAKNEPLSQKWNDVPGKPDNFQYIKELSHFQFPHKMNKQLTADVEAVKKFMKQVNTSDVMLERLERFLKAENDDNDTNKLYTYFFFGYGMEYLDVWGRLNEWQQAAIEDENWGIH